LKAGFSEKEIEEKFFEFGQGYQSMSPAHRSLESLLLNKKMAHGGHPLLAMCAARAVVHRDPSGNRKLNKAKSRGRIDGMVCLAMAAGLAEANVEEKPKEYQMMFV
jgi:phage terminase large subunit-like protein